MYEQTESDYLALFSPHVQKLSGHGDQLRGLCPFHDDHNPSWSGNRRSGLWHCFGCDASGNAELFLQRIGAHTDARNGHPQRRIVATYDYVDEDGTLLYQAVRFAPKGFSQRQPDGCGGWRWKLEGVRRVLYRLPEIFPAETVYLPEGEKDANRLWSLEIPATTSPQGAGKWREEYNESLRSKQVVILPDNDEPGEQHALQVARSLLPVAKTVKIVRLPDLPPKGDVSDWLDAGHSKVELVALVEATPILEADETRDSKEAGSSAHAESPRPLRRQLPEATPYPVEELLRLAPVAKSLHATIQAPLALCGQSVLAAVSLAVQGYADIHIDGRVYPLSAYCITVGESGERKTAVDREVLRPHREYEKRLVEKYEALRQDYENDLAGYKKAREEALKKAKTREEKKNALAIIGPEPLEPLLPILLTEEPTYEGLIKLLLHGHPSLGLFADEAGRFIGGYGMSEEHQLKTASGLSELWDGKRISRVRGGDGAALLYGRRVAMHLMAQPQVAQRVLSNSLLIDQGLMSRCLVTWPESTAGTRQYKETNLRADQALLAYSQRITAILTSSLPLAEGKRNELSPRSLTLSEEAKALWIKFHNAVENLLPDNQPFAPIRGFANKAPEHALRLAGILTLYGDLHASQISTEEVKAGIALAQHYLEEALRLFHSSLADPDLLLAEKLLTWAQQRDPKHVALVDIYQRGLNAISDAATARRLVKILEAHGWFVPVAGGLEVDGQFRREVWAVQSAEV